MRTQDFEGDNLFDNKEKIFSEINVTPLVDVVLVLLIIFMVTAPMMQHEVRIELPKASTKEMKSGSSSLILVITKQKEIFISKYKFPIQNLSDKLKVIYENRADKDIFIKADKDVNYGFVVQVMAAIRKAGLGRIGLVSMPK